jgi:hypothetical protein
MSKPSGKRQRPRLVRHAASKFLYLSHLQSPSGRPHFSDRITHIERTLTSNQNGTIRLKRWPFSRATFGANTRQKRIGHPAENGTFYRACLYILRDGKKPSSYALFSTGKNRGKSCRGSCAAAPCSALLLSPAFSPPPSAVHNSCKIYIRL